jgi:hypothetical protein
MPLPLVPLAIGALIGSAGKKDKKKQAVSKYTTEKGKKVKAYTRKGK